MALETFTTEINGRTFEVREFDGETALELVTDMLQLAAPMLAGAGKKYDSSKALTEQEVDIDAMVSNLSVSLSTPKVKGLVMRLLKNTILHDQRPDGTFPVIVDSNFKTVFTARNLLKDLPPLLSFVIRENFGGFSGLVSYISHIGGGAQASK